MNILKTMKPDRKLKPKEVANLAGISVKTLQRWDKNGTLKARRTPTNRRYYYPKDLVNLFINPAGFGSVSNRHNLTSANNDRPGLLSLLEQRHQHLDDYASILLGNQVAQDFEKIDNELADEEAGRPIEYTFNAENARLAVMSPDEQVTKNFLKVALFSLFDVANPSDLRIAVMGTEDDQWVTDLTERFGYKIGLTKMTNQDSQYTKLLIINHLSKAVDKQVNRTIIQQAILAGTRILAIDSNWNSKSSQMILSQFNSRVIYGPLKRVEQYTEFLPKSYFDGIVGDMEPNEFIGQLVDSDSSTIGPLTHGIMPTVDDQLAKYLLDQLDKAKQNQNKLYAKYNN